MACPFTAATTGVRSSNAAGRIGDAVKSSTPRVDAKASSAALKSAPTQNADPAPVSTIARTASSASQARYASPSNRPISAVYALSRSGRLSVRTAMPPETSTVRSEFISFLPPVDDATEPVLAEHRFEHGREVRAPPQRLTAVDVDDLPGDPGRSIAQQEQREHCNVGDLADTG